MYANPFSILVRSLARRLGLTAFISPYLVGNAGESSVAETLFSAIQPNDVVWDIGTNVGDYTVLFAEKACSGLVYAFEPLPENVRQLRQRVTQLRNVHVLEYALGDFDGDVGIVRGNEINATTATILGANSSPDCVVSCHRGDTLIEAGEVHPPDIIKLDVEGAEVKVLRGLERCLQATGLSLIVVEVHFGVLQKHSQINAFRNVLRRLQKCGFDVRWIGPSHLVARRSRATFPKRK